MNFVLSVDQYKDIRYAKSAPISVETASPLVRLPRQSYTLHQLLETSDTYRQISGSKKLTIISRNLVHGNVPLNLLILGVMIEENEDELSTPNLDFFPVKLVIGEMQNFGATVAAPILVLLLDPIFIAKSIDR